MPKNTNSKLSIILEEEKRISPFSLWGDDIWKFDQTTAGKREGSSSINWCFLLADGTRFVDSRWQSLLKETKLFVWGYYISNQRNLHPKLSAIGYLFFELEYFIKWMTQEGFNCFADLTSDAVSTFVDYLVEDKVEIAEEEMCVSTLAKYLDIPLKIFDQRRVLENAGFRPMPEHPYKGKSAKGLAKSMVRKVAKKIPPVPDEVFLPVVNKAIEWLDTQAGDIIRLLELYVLWDDEYLSRHTIAKKRRQRLEGFQFSIPPGDTEPWRPILMLGPGQKEIRIRCYRRDNGKTEEITRLRYSDVIRALFTDLRNACIIVLQALVALRVSEMCGLQAEPRDPTSNFPYCVELRPSRSGLYEIFYIRGRVYKTRQQWEDVTWVAGSRPYGNNYVPPPIKAVQILDNLFRPFRELSGRSELILSLGVKGFSENPNQYTPLCSGKLGEEQKDWIRQYVELPKDFADWNLTTHQWRKSFALYMVRSDSRLLRAVSNHFKHISLAMTESYYVGNDPELLDLVNDVALQETARVLYEFATGQVSAAGKFAERFQTYLENLQKLVSKQPPEEGIQQFKDILSGDDVRLWSCDWGYCLFRAESSRCHQLADTMSFGNTYPNYVKRSPGVCCECSNLIVLPEHLQFWEVRYQNDLNVLNQHKSMGYEDMMPLLEERVRQSEVILRMLGKQQSSK